MPQPIEITMQWANVPLDRIFWHLHRRHLRLSRQKRPTWQLALFLAVLFTALVALLQTHAWLSDVLVEFLGAMIFLLIVLVIAYPILRRSNRKTMDLMKGGIRQGDTRVVFSDDGMQSHHPSGGQLVRWPYIADVAEFRGFTLLLLTPMEFMPIPDDSLPPGMTRADFLDRIDTWRSQHLPKP